MFISVVNIWVGLRGKRFTRRSKNTVRLGLAAGLIFFQSAWLIWLFMVGEATIRTALPLHLCNLMVLLSAIMLLLKSQHLFQYTYFLGGGGALAALWMPDLGIYGFPHFLFFQTFLVHGCLLTSQTYMAACEGFRPKFISLIKSYLALNLYVPVIAIFNHLFSTNYLFLTAKPSSPTLLDWLGSPPWYYVWVELIILVVFCLLYLPFYLHRRTICVSRSSSTIKNILSKKPSR